MINLLKIISIICIVIALFVGIPQFIKTIKILKELKKINPDDITAEPIIKESFKIIKPMLVAISLYMDVLIENLIIYQYH